jgi:CheY-like chemotaxis protein
MMSLTMNPETDDEPARGSIELRGGRSGTTFNMALELEKSMPVPIAPLPAQDRGSVKEIDAYPNARVLVAEDDLVNRTIIVSMLKRFQILPDVALNGSEALACCLRGTYDLILMDQRMPVMGGIEATIAIRDHERETATPRIPVLAVSANISAEDFQQFTAAGMDDLLKKPLRLVDLDGALKRWLGEPRAAPKPVEAPSLQNSPV